MKYKRFEDLPVWQAAIEFAVKVFELTAKPDFKGYYSLKDQLERAAVSISNNTAEGFERGTNNELIRFLEIAKGSSGESRSMLCLLERMPNFFSLKPEITALKIRGENIGKQLGGWIESLKNSDYKGARFVNDKTRQDEQKRKEYLEWKKELDAINEASRLEREAMYRAEREAKEKKNEED